MHTLPLMFFKLYKLFFPRLSQLLLLLLCSGFGGYAALSQGQSLLPTEKAFALQTPKLQYLDQGKIGILLEWRIAKGYYLYQKSLTFQLQAPAKTAGTPPPAAQVIPNPALPPALQHSDATFGKVAIYRDSLVVSLPLPILPTRPTAAAAADIPSGLQLEVSSQGCADIGVCYPPRTDSIALSTLLSPKSGQPPLWNDTTHAGNAPQSPSPSSDAEAPLDMPDLLQNSSAISTEHLLNLLEKRGLGWILLVFVLLGLGLSLTPCVLPMLPLLSSMLLQSASAASLAPLKVAPTTSPKASSAASAAGEDPPPARRLRAMWLVIAYCIGMICTYTVLGLVAAALGIGMGAALQKPALQITLALLVAFMAVLLLRDFSLALPAALQFRMDQYFRRQTSTSLKLLAAGGMGMLAAIIVSPCVSLPLAAILVFVGQKQSFLMGGLALASLAFGMCIPLLLLGISAGRWLPQSGPWLETTKTLFALLMLGLAIWMLGTVATPRMQMLLFALLGLFAAWLFWRGNSSLGRHYRSFMRIAMTMLCLAFAGIQGYGAWKGNIGPLAPLSSHIWQHRITSVDEFSELQGQAYVQGKRILLDFYADWCITCVEMEARTFSDASVRKALEDWVLVQADVTANTAKSIALLEMLNLYGPPGTLAFGAEGQELMRIIGFVNAAEFLRQLPPPVPSPE